MELNKIVIAGLVPAIHDLDHEDYSQTGRSWMAGTRPAMTK